MDLGSKLSALIGESHSGKTAEPAVQAFLKIQTAANLAAQSSIAELLVGTKKMLGKPNKLVPTARKRQKGGVRKSTRGQRHNFQSEQRKKKRDSVHRSWRTHSESSVRHAMHTDEPRSWGERQLRARGRSVSPPVSTRRTFDSLKDKDLSPRCTRSLSPTVLRNTTAEGDKTMIDITSLKLS
jgi:hypothetical protein